MTPAPVRVMLCDDSLTVRAAFGRILEADPGLRIVARALPLLPLAAHWRSLADAALAAGLAPLLDAEGRFSDPALHPRLELLTLLRALGLGLDAEVVRRV